MNKGFGDGECLWSLRGLSSSEKDCHRLPVSTLEWWNECATFLSGYSLGSTVSVGDDCDVGKGCCFRGSGTPSCDADFGRPINDGIGSNFSLPSEGEFLRDRGCSGIGADMNSSSVLDNSDTRSSSSFKDGDFFSGEDGLFLGIDADINSSVTLVTSGTSRASGKTDGFLLPVCAGDEACCSFSAEGLFGERELLRLQKFDCCSGDISFSVI